PKSSEEIFWRTICSARKKKDPSRPQRCSLPNQSPPAMRKPPEGPKLTFCLPRRTAVVPGWPNAPGLESARLPLVASGVGLGMERVHHKRKSVSSQPHCGPAMFGGRQIIGVGGGSGSEYDGGGGGGFTMVGGAIISTGPGG